VIPVIPRQISVDILECGSFHAVQSGHFSVLLVLCGDCRHDNMMVTRAGNIQALGARIIAIEHIKVI
jgi:hypothetical protein